MYTILWLVIVTFIGFEASIHLHPDTNPLIGAGVGFLSGGSLRVAFATGSADFIGGMFEVLGEVLGGMFSN
jgi:hypothetical protein